MGGPAGQGLPQESAGVGPDRVREGLTLEGVGPDRVREGLTCTRRVGPDRVRGGANTRESGEGSNKKPYQHSLCKTSIIQKHLWSLDSLLYVPSELKSCSS